MRVERSNYELTINGYIVEKTRLNNGNTLYIFYNQNQEELFRIETYQPYISTDILEQMINIYNKGYKDGMIKGIKMAKRKCTLDTTI